MAVEQEVLEQLLRASISARGHSLADVASFVDGRWQPREPETGPPALVILRRFDAARYVSGAAAFVARLEPAEREAWYRAFTRTAFLVGDPRRVAVRFGALLTWRTDDAAWTWSPEERATLGLRRLLKPLRTSGPATLEPRVRCELGGGPRRDLCVATGGLRLEQYLVHLNHTLCESLITGALQPGDRLELRHVPRIESLPALCRYVRVVPDADDPTRLAAVAYVSAAEER